MKVLQVIHGFSTGGAETLVKDYLLLMHSKGIEVKALCYESFNSPFESQLKDAGIDIVNVSESIPHWTRKLGKLGIVIWYIYVYLKFRSFIRFYKPDIIHAHLGINRILKFAIKHNEPLLFYTVHTEPQVLWFSKRKGIAALRKRAELNATMYLIRNKRMQLIALHEPMKRELDKIFNIENTLILNNGIDFTKFKNLRSKYEMRKELGIPNDAFLVGHVGRMVPQKNHRKVLSVFKELFKTKKNAFLLLVGSGPDLKEIMDFIERENIGERVVILSNRGDVPDLMNAMDVFLFPSRFEGLGIVLIEAQKVKLPCVIADTIPSHAIISNYVHTLSLTRDDGEWVQAMLEKIPDEIVYDHLEEWDMNSVVNKLLEIYRTGLRDKK